MLTIAERARLARFVLLSREAQLDELAAAINDPSTSGPLVRAMRDVARICYGTRI